MNKTTKKTAVTEALHIHPPTSPFLLALAFFATFAGFNIWRSTFHNYSVEVFQADATQIGFAFSLMSVPGVLAFSIGLIASKVRIYKLLIFACTMLGLGLIWISLVSGWNATWPGILAISFGFTFFYPVINTLCLLDSAPEAAAVRIGHLKSFGPLASMGATVLVLLCLPWLGFRPFLALAGVLVMCCGITAALGMRSRQYTLIQGQFRLEPSLWPYYTLNFMAGCRSALFKAFVLFLLVNEYGFKIESTALIILASNLAGFFGYRLIGRFTSRFSRKNVLSIVYAAVALIFLGFSLFDQAWMVSLLFLLDSLLFSTAVVTDSYLKERSPPQNLVGDLSMGLSLFYLAGVLLPLLGGALWQHFGYEGTFLLGSALAVLSIAISRYL